MILLLSVFTAGSCCREDPGLFPSEEGPGRVQDVR